MAASTDTRAGRIPPHLRGWVRLCAVIACVVALVAAVSPPGAGGPEASQTISNVGLCVAAVSAASGCLVRARRSAGRMRRAGRYRARRAVLGLGQAAGSGSRRSSVTRSPFPSQADIGYLGMVLLPRPAC